MRGERKLWRRTLFVRETKQSLPDFGMPVPHTVSDIWITLVGNVMVKVFVSMSVLSLWSSFNIWSWSQGAVGNTWNLSCLPTEAGRSHTGASLSKLARSHLQNKANKPGVGRFNAYRFYKFMCLLWSGQLRLLPIFLSSPPPPPLPTTFEIIL